MEAATAIVNQVVPILMIPVNRYLRYLISCTKYVRDMVIKMTELNAARVSVEQHMARNTSSRLEVPNQVMDWLDDVRKVNAKVENVPRDVGGCFNIKIRHRAGRNASNIIQKIDSLMTIHSLIHLTDHPIPLGRVGSIQASTSTLSTEHNDFRSREVTFMEALKALGPSHESHMIALCGMGGVGKTTMMERLKKASEEKRMFQYIAVAVIGETTDPIAIQDAVANYLSIELKETIKEARAVRLREWFKDNSDGGKTKFLIVMDDVWELVDLNDIGLSRFPNEGVDFKVLLTSRDRHVCIGMGVEANSILNVKVLTDVEGQRLFRQFVKRSADVDLDPDFQGIANDIASRCQGLPIIIKTMAATLKGRSKHAWDDALSRLNHHKMRKELVHEVFKISYDNLQDEETKLIFLLCALFPEDFDIPTEELVRYGWGLKLFKDVNTIREARNRLNTCTERLWETNLLIESNDAGCVKMHDLVRAFVWHMFSEVEHASIVNQASTPGWPDNDISDSCKRISLTCTGMSEFPRDLKFPKLMILKLMNGDKSLTFPQDFYEEMRKLQVISYDKMKYPLLPSSPQCSTNLQVLHLYQCSMIFDCSSIGNLLNLEVLSFANSGTDWLPYAIGNLKKLRLLDLTNCNGLGIDNGVLRNLVKLEELYMTVAGGQDRKAIRFTDENCNEMAVLSENLSAFELEFVGNDLQPKNMSFEKLQRFRISLGSYFDRNFRTTEHKFENTLRLVTNKGEVLKCRMNQLFGKTEVLYLEVDDINDLSDVDVKSAHATNSFWFFSLRVLVVSECTELRYLFTLGVANSLSKLEHLEVKSCNNMEELIHIGDHGEETITLPLLKCLSLHKLPKLSGLCNNGNIVKLPQLMELKLNTIPGFTSIYPDNKFETSSFLKEELLIPKLETLRIDNMENLEEIWPREFSTSQKVKLREIQVKNCDNLVNIFPCNPMSLLKHLEGLTVEKCRSIKALFDIDLDTIGEIGEGTSSSSLKRIKANTLCNLRKVWRIKGADNSHLLICGFQSVERIEIRECKRFRNVFTPITTNFDLGALTEIYIDYCVENKRTNELAEGSQEEQINIQSKEETSEVSDSTLDVAEVVFEIESPRSRELVTTQHNQRLLPYLEELDISFLHKMSRVWKCNWNKFLILEKQQSGSPFPNLTTITLERCKNIKYLFSPLMAKLLSGLKKVNIESCDGIEEVVSNRDDEDEENSTFTHSRTTVFPNLKCIGGGGANDGSNEISFDKTTTTTATTFLNQFKSSQVGGVSWTLCQFLREISIKDCDALSSVIPLYAAGQMQKLEVVKIRSCDGMKELFETQGIKKSGCDEGKGGTPGIPRLNNVIMLPNLKILKIKSCRRLEHIFTFSALESLQQLQELTIEGCEEMKVIVKEEHAYREQTTMESSSKEVVVFPRLNSITLLDLPELVGFFLGKTEFRWPSLDYVMIKECPQIMVFASGGSTAPQLKYIHTSFGKHSLKELM